MARNLKPPRRTSAVDNQVVDSATSQALPAQASLGITQAVLLEIIVHGPVARSTVAHRLDRSQARVSRVVATLLRAGLVHETAAEQIESGRPLVPLTVEPSTMRFLGVKITGDRAYAVVTDLAGEINDQWEVPLTGHEPNQVVDLLTALHEDARDRVGEVRAIGVSLGGHVANGRDVRRAPFLEWSDVPLADLLEAATQLPVTVENDVRALTLAEHWFGAARGRSTFAIVTLGAGVGLGLVTGNLVVSGDTSFAGAIGHQRLTNSTATCELGHVGCARALLAKPLLEARATAALGRPTMIEDLIEAGESGDEHAAALLHEAGEALGRLIGGVANVIDPGLVIISGEGAPVARATRSAISDGLTETLHWAGTRPDVVIADFDFVEWARGAAIVAMQSVVLGAEFAALLDELARAAAITPSLTAATEKAS